jgi:type I restriction enzyme S subunit
MNPEVSVGLPSLKLEDLVELIIDHRGKTPKKLGGDFTESGIPVISAIHIKRGKIIWEERERFVTQEMYEKWMKEPLRKDDVLLTSEAPLGEVALVPNNNPLVLSQRLFAIRTKADLLHPKYLLYFLQSQLGQDELQGRASGSTVIGIRQAELMNIAVPCPELHEQRAIGEFLSALDSKITCNEEISETLINLAQTIFKSWFIEFDPVKAKIAGEKPTGMEGVTAALFPDSMEESEIGFIPSGWNVEPAADLFEVGIGRTPPRKEPKWFCKGTEGIPWVSIRDMGTFKTYSHATNEGLTQAAVDKFKVPVVPENTVLMSFKLTVGKLCISDTDLVTNEAIAHFRISQNSPLDTFYTYLWLSNLDMGSLDSTSSIGIATNSGVIKQIKFLVPPQELLDSFHDKVSSIFSQLKLLRRQTTNLVLLRDSLLPRLMSGELKIPREIKAS